jgi:hypothetical protein
MHNLWGPKNLVASVTAWLNCNLYSMVDVGGRIITPWCYCISYNISTVASTVLARCLLQYKPNLRKMIFSINEVGSSEVN